MRDPLTPTGVEHGHDLTRRDRADIGYALSMLLIFARQHKRPILPIERTIKIKLLQRKIRELDLLPNKRILAAICNSRQNRRTILADRQLSKVDVANSRVPLNRRSKPRRWQPTGNGVNQPIGPCPLGQVPNPWRVDQSPID